MFDITVDSVNSVATMCAPFCLGSFKGVEQRAMVTLCIVVTLIIVGNIISHFLCKCISCKCIHFL